ncbi:MAG TPA: endonuclease/exonuclease/phosphatase family protein [bacterium]|nr:endonuclease/exonuclease/phosphatase family protein [bacterium]
MALNDLEEACRLACGHLAQSPLEGPAQRRLRHDSALRERIEAIAPLLHTCGTVHAPATPPDASKDLAPSGEIRAVSWNIERGKRFEALARTLTEHRDLKDADIYLLTEVDWGMARSGNRNVTADLGKALGFHAYFAPSYFNFTSGHGSERHITEPNTLGLHGKAILSRFPLENLRVSAMTNATDKLKSKEVRLGQKRSLVGELPVAEGRLSVACVHLDAFSSPRMRAFQFQEAVRPLLNGSSSLPALVAGDWNTNTMNSTSGRTLFASVLRQLLSPGPSRMISGHHGFPQKKFDRPLFETLRKIGLDYENFNEEGVGTFDLVTDDLELGQMAKDQFPEWILRWINRIVAKSGGQFSLKLDWFAARGLRPLLKKVVRLKPVADYEPGERPSDHHPVLLTFEIF